MSTITHLNDFAVVVCPSLAGCKKAVLMGSKLHVSPAMYDLISNASSDAELLHLLRHIGLVELPDFVPYEALPMMVSDPF